MSRPQTYEQSVLYAAEKILTSITDDYNKRMLIIEACAALYGGYDIDHYWKAFNIKVSNKEQIIRTSIDLYNAINDTGIVPSMAIASLSREPIEISEMKKNGAFYTDFRLSEFVSNDCEKYIKKNSKVADLAAGTGILLAGIAEKYLARYPDSYDSWISKCVYAFDLSDRALRGARSALSVNTKSIETLVKMYGNWEVCDTLLTNHISDKSFDIVVGNPPWGKTKLSLHSFVNGNGTKHVYGDEFEKYDKNEFEIEKQNYLSYCKKLKDKYTLIGDAEPDMYMAFLQKAMSAIRSDGHLSYIVPAGLIRSQGTETLRRYINSHSSCLTYYLFDNKARFFSIDSRFKFLIISQNTATTKNKRCNELYMSLCSCKSNNIICGEIIEYDINDLESIRPDLTIPECRDTAEKELFFRICKNGKSWKETWNVDVLREVDMTNNRKHFHKQRKTDDIPVVEGRMVQQFRFGAKVYSCGSGRSAQWLPTSYSEPKPQFYINKGDLSPVVQERINHYRVGYCDIAGQTNERGMMSALIPPTVVCGNKVPTILFANDNLDIAFFWIGVTNSFVFDWLLRRVLTTTVNYFLLFSLPMPNISLDSAIAKKIITKSKALCQMKEEFYTDTSTEKLRAEIDVLVAEAYGLNYDDLLLVLNDFPLLDRAQKRINNEEKSTITKDLLFSHAEKLYKIKEKRHVKRYNEYVKLGARAYIPTEMTLLIDRG